MTDLQNEHGSGEADPAHPEPAKQREVPKSSEGALGKYLTVQSTRMKATSPLSSLTWANSTRLLLRNSLKLLRRNGLKKVRKKVVERVQGARELLDHQ